MAEWQTRQSQKLLGNSPCGFDSHLRHQYFVLGKIMEEIKLNNRVYDPVLYNPNVLLRIEDCILKARTELSKRRLIKTAIAISMLAAVDIERSSMAGW